MINQEKLLILILIYSSIILIINRNKNFNLIFKKALFNSLILPSLIILTYYAFINNNYQLFYMYLSILLVSIIVSYKNIYIDTFIAISYIWLLFIIMNIFSGNNINKLSIIYCILTSIYILYYSYKSKYSFEIRNP